MASLFGIFKKMFGGAGDISTGDISTGDINAGHTSTGEKSNIEASSADDAKPAVADSDTQNSDSNVLLADGYVETGSSVVEQVTEVGSSEMILEAEGAVIAAAAAIGGVSGAATDAITAAVTTAFSDDEASDEVGDEISDEEAETPVLPPLKLKKDVVFLDRDHFVLPQSETVSKAMAFVNKEANAAASARAMRVFDYGVAAADAYDLRVDKELLVLAAIFRETGDFAASKAESFLIDNNMWKSLAGKVGFAIENVEEGLTSNDIETRVLSLGVQAEEAHGEIEYVHPATAAETRSRHAA